MTSRGKQLGKEIQDRRPAGRAGALSLAGATLHSTAAPRFPRMSAPPITPPPSLPRRLRLFLLPCRLLLLVLCVSFSSSPSSASSSSPPSTSTFDRAVQHLFENPSDLYLGLGEEERHDPSAAVISTLHRLRDGPGGGVFRSAFEHDHLAGIPLVSIHAAGTFKFVLLRVAAASSSIGTGGQEGREGREGVEGLHEDQDEWELIVRSADDIDLHADLFEAAKREVSWSHPRAQVSLLGGGRLKRDAAGDVAGAEEGMSVYGFSATFGRCARCNEITAAILRKNFPGEAVAWSNEGY